MTSPEPQEHCEKEPMYLVTKKELDMIKNDCAYPTRQFCDCCEYAEGEDPERASGLGCNFIGANALMDIVLTRQQQPRDAVKADAGELTAEDVIAITRAELDDELIREALHIAIHERIGYSEAEHDATIRAEAKREERERVLTILSDFVSTCIFIDDPSNCPGVWNEGEESDCDGCSYADFPNVESIRKKIKSLRQGVQE